MHILIVDDHALFAEGLRLILAGTSPMEDAVCCANAKEALQAARTTAFDLVLLDWHLGQENSGDALLAALQALQPNARIVVVSGESNPAVVRQAIDAGACGFVPKESSPALLIDALTITAHGGIYLPRSVLASPGMPGTSGTSGVAPGTTALCSIAQAFPELSPRHVQVLQHLVRGKSNKLIGRELDISDGTVKQHLNAIYRELNVANRTEAVYLLARRGVRFGE